MVSGVLCVRNDAGCTCRTWSLTDVDIEEETERVEARQAEYDEYCAAVAAWNDHVTSAPPEETFSFFEYCNFLLNAYDEIESGRATLVVGQP